MELSEARKAFPCFDEPSLKARFDITIVRKPNYVAITTMPKIRTDTELVTSFFIIFKKYEKIIIKDL